MRESSVFIERRSRSAAAALISGLCVAITASLALLASNNPWASMLVGAGICAAVLGVFLLLRPLHALYLAIFFTLLPGGLRVEPIYTVISNLTVLVALLGWIVQWVLRRECIRWNVTWLLLAAYIAIGIISLLWAPDLIEGRRKAVAYSIGFVLLFLLVHQMRNLRSVDGLMAAMRLIGWIIVAGGLFAIASGSYQPGQRLSIYEINQNQLVMVMLLLVPAFVWPVLRSSGPARKLKMLLGGIFILCTFIFTVLSGSRGGALSLIVMLGGLFLSRQVRPWAFLGAILSVGAIVAAPSVLITIAQRFEEPEGGSFGGRDLLWEAGLLLIQDRPWSGVGLGGGPLELPKYVAMLTGDPFLNGKRVLQSHNPLLEVGADTGLFGMMLYGSILASALWQTARKRRPAESGQVMSFYRPLILVVAAAYFISWIKSGGVENNPTFFILLGLLLIPALMADVARQEEIR